MEGRFLFLFHRTREFLSPPREESFNPFFSPFWLLSIPPLFDVDKTGLWGRFHSDFFFQYFAFPFFFPGPDEEPRGSSSFFFFLPDVTSGPRFLFFFFPNKMRPFFPFFGSAFYPFPGVLISTLFFFLFVGIFQRVLLVFLLYDLFLKAFPYFLFPLKFGLPPSRQWTPFPFLEWERVPPSLSNRRRLFVVWFLARTPCPRFFLPSGSEGLSFPLGDREPSPRCFQ